MSRPLPPCFPALLPWAALAFGLAVVGVGPARAADLPFLPAPPPVSGAPFSGAPSHGAPRFGGGGFSAPRVPVRPAPLRYDIYGYPVSAGVPSPLAVGNGCPAAIQPDYDPDGNFAGYAPIPMCR